MMIVMLVMLVMDILMVNTGQRNPSGERSR